MCTCATKPHCDAHGPEFLALMHKIDVEAGTNITVSGLLKGFCWKLENNEPYPFVGFSFLGAQCDALLAL